MNSFVIQAAAAAAALLYLAGLALGFPWWLMVGLKVLPVAALWLWVFLDGRIGPYRNRILAGLACSLLADAVLDWPGDYFLAGLAAFACAHLAYIAAYLSRDRRFAPGWLLVAVVAAGMMLLALQRHGDLGELRIAVFVYASLLATMLWRAGAQRRVDRTASYALWGAALFVVSDAMIGWQRFVQPSALFDYPIMLCYWLAQWGIAMSTFSGRR